MQHARRHSKPPRRPLLAGFGFALGNEFEKRRGHSEERNQAVAEIIKVRQTSLVRASRAASWHVDAMQREVVRRLLGRQAGSPEAFMLDTMLTVELDGRDLGTRPLPNSRLCSPHGPLLSWPRGGHE